MPVWLQFITIVLIAILLFFLIIGKYYIKK